MPCFAGFSDSPVIAALLLSLSVTVFQRLSHCLCAFQYSSQGVVIAFEMVTLHLSLSVTACGCQSLSVCPSLLFAGFSDSKGASDCARHHDSNSATVNVYHLLCVSVSVCQCLSVSLTVWHLSGVQRTERQEGALRPRHGMPHRIRPQWTPLRHGAPGKYPAPHMKPYALKVEEELWRLKS